MMLVLSRREGQRILVGDDIVITLARLGTESARIGIEIAENEQRRIG